jgi:hypothetical protein
MSEYTAGYKTGNSDRVILGGRIIFPDEIAIAVTREMAGIYTQGQSHPKVFSRGKRSISISFGEPIPVPNGDDLIILAANREGRVCRLSAHNLALLTQDYKSWIAETISWWRWVEIEEIYKELQKMPGIGNPAIFLNDLQQAGVERGDK